MSLFRKIFGPKLAFQPVDPLDDGLRDMIRREQRSDHAFDLYEDVGEIERFWSRIARDTDLRE